MMISAWFSLWQKFLRQYWHEHQEVVILYFQISMCVNLSSGDVHIVACCILSSDTDWDPWLCKYDNMAQDTLG